MKKISRGVIIDGYVDEPACLGVPPYISPYVRYCAGAFASRGADLSYMTCDQWRAERERLGAVIADADLVVVIMGLTVPGRYRGGSPLTLRELAEIAALPRRGALALGGPVKAGYALRGGARARRIMPDAIDFFAEGDIEASVEKYLRTGEWDGYAELTAALREEIAPAGASVAKLHPCYPHVLAELELSRGCDRVDGRCSFCSEGHGAAYSERSAECAAREAAALDAAGVRAFRLGRCANILAWGADMTPRGALPNARRIRELYEAIRAAAPHLEVLHGDNCNPATVARFPEESAKALATIAELGTEGDVASLGVESADGAVIAANSLKVSADEAYLAVRIINEAGGYRKRRDGMPSLLPGLNFLYGLAGESATTTEANSKFLRRLLEDGLAVRRINIRRAIVLDGTPLSSASEAGGVRERELKRWKRWVREEADPEMMRRVAPDGTVIRGVIIDERAGHVAFGRPLGSYPPLVGVVSGTLSLGDVTDAAVTGRGARSLTAVPWPLDINQCDESELEALPEIGRARARALVARRPYNCEAEAEAAFHALDAPDGIFKRLRGFFGM